MSFSIRREQGLLCHRVSKYVTIEFLTFMSNDLLITYMFNNVIHIHFCVSGDIFIFLVRVPPPFSIFVLKVIKFIQHLRILLYLLHVYKNKSIYTHVCVFFFTFICCHRFQEIKWDIWGATHHGF